MPLIIIPNDIRARIAAMSPEQIEEARARLASSRPRQALDTSQPEGPPPTSATTAGKKRRYIDRSDQWPAVGTVLEGHFRGECFRAQVISAPKLKSKKALKLLTPPVRGTVATSFSKAQDVVTLAHRQRLGVKGKTGLPAAWNWWKPVPAPAS